jgi:hypothetical protein
VNRLTAGGEGLTPGVGDLGRVEYRVPLKLDVSRERNVYDMVQAVENNPLQQSLRKNAMQDDKDIAARMMMIN